MRDYIRTFHRPMRGSQGRRVRGYMNLHEPLGPYQVSIAGPSRERLLLMLSPAERELIGRVPAWVDRQRLRIKAEAA